MSASGDNLKISNARKTLNSQRSRNGAGSFGGRILLRVEGDKANYHEQLFWVRKNHHKHKN